MTDIARILLGVPAEFEERRVLVFTPSFHFPRSDYLVDELPQDPPDDDDKEYELYLHVYDEDDEEYYVVLLWDEDSGSWYERYDPEHTNPEDELNTDYFTNWHSRKCLVPKSVATVLA
jgi:hypothetical protein